MPTPAENTKIWAAARELGLSEDQLRDLVHQVSGQRSTRALTSAQTRALLDALVRLGARPGTRRKPSGRRAADGVFKLITPAQRELIDALRGELGGDWLSDKYFAGACRKRLRGKERPTTAADGARMIEALKQRLAYNQRKAAG